MAADEQKHTGFSEFGFGLQLPIRRRQLGQNVAATLLDAVVVHEGPDALTSAAAIGHDVCQGTQLAEEEVAVVCLIAGNDVARLAVLLDEACGAGAVGLE